MRSIHSTLAVLAMFLLAANGSAQETRVDFATRIQPLLESACLRCHNAKTAEGKLRLDTRAGILAGGENGPAIVPGKPDESPLYKTSILPTGTDGAMPPDGPPLSKSQTDLLRNWITQGAPWPDDATLEVQPRIDFVKHIQPLLETNCVSCHRADHAEGEFSLSTRKSAFESGATSPAIVPFQPDKSPLYALTILDLGDEKLMPRMSNSSRGPRHPASLTRRTTGC